MESRHATTVHTERAFRGHDNAVRFALMRAVIQGLREKFHPLHRARKSAVGRAVLRAADRPAWISVPAISFKVRAQILTHGLSFGVIGSQERNPETLALCCVHHLGVRSFWDVGANFGYYSWLLKSAAPDLQVLLIEPLPANASLIRATIQRNKFADVTLIEAGASDCSGEATLHADELGGSTSSLNDEVTFEQEHFGLSPKLIRVPLVSIDTLRAQRGPIDLMKIDVEGHEAATLRGAAETIGRDRPILFIECAHPEHPCVGRLESAGYTIVDADHLSLDCAGGSINFFCFPANRKDSVERILRLARGSSAAQGNGSGAEISTEKGVSAGLHGERS